MSDNRTDFTDASARVKAAAEQWKGRHLRQEFVTDPARSERYRSEWDGLVVDWSKHRIDDETLGALVALAEQRGVLARRDAMLRGEPVNETERRAVMHTALRHMGPGAVRVQGVDVMPDVRDVRDAMWDFVAAV